MKSSRCRKLCTAVVNLRCLCFEHHHVIKPGRQLAFALHKRQVYQDIDQVSLLPLPAMRADNAAGIGWHWGDLIFWYQGAGVPGLLGGVVAVPTQQPHVTKGGG